MTALPQESPAAPHDRPFSEADYWRVRAMLIETYPLTGLGFNWEIRRWDGWRYYDADPAWQPQWAQTFRVWEAPNGQLAGLVHPAGAGSAQLQIHPAYRAQVETPMIAWAEATLAAPDDSGQQQLTFDVYDYDAPRRRILAERGYTQLAQTWVMRRLVLGGQPLPLPELPAGYTLRTTRPGDEADFARAAALLNTAFGRTFHNPGEYRSFTRLAPCFRHDLDLVAEAPDGSFAAHAGVIYDAANRRGLFEPVSTHPDHRRQGLAQALMREGLRRLKALGARAVTVETGEAIAANRLYESMGFTEAYLGHVWRRAL